MTPFLILIMCVSAWGIFAFLLILALIRRGSSVTVDDGASFGGDYR